MTIKCSNIVGFGGAIASGSTNPGSPAPNQIFFRTDLGLLIYYDGTRWLTVNEYYAAFTSSNNTVSSWDTTGMYSPVNQQFDMYITKWLSLFDWTAGTINGSNYWTFRLRKLTAAGVATDIDTYNNSAGATLNTIVTVTRNIGAIVAKSLALLGQVMTATGSPGGTYQDAGIYYRLVVT